MTYASKFNMKEINPKGELVLAKERNLTTKEVQNDVRFRVTEERISMNDLTSE